MINYKKQIQYIKQNPQFLMELVNEHMEKVKKKHYKEKEEYYHFKNKINNDKFDFSLGELLVDTYSGLAIDNIFIQNKKDKKIEESVKNVLNNIEFTNAIKDKCLKKSCILGTSFIMLALEKTKENEIGDLRILTLSPHNTYIKYNEFGRGVWAFRYYLSTNAVGKITDESNLVIEFVDNLYITTYENINGEMKLKSTYLHGFDMLPIAEFSLNEYRSDILTKAIKGTKKAVEILNNADFSLKKSLKEYLVAHNIKVPTDKQLKDIINQILTDRVAVLNDNVSADGQNVLNSGLDIISSSGITNFSEWLDFCKYIIQLIFITSNIPNFSSEDFTNPQSGAALKMQMVPANAKISSTISFFKKSIRYILEVLQPYFKIKYNIKYDIDDFEINIKNYEYANITEIAQAVSTLKATDIFANTTLIKLANIVEDANAEIEAKKEQDAEEVIDYINRVNKNER